VKAFERAFPNLCFTLATGVRVSRAESTHFYGRKECRSCGGEVVRYMLRARSVYVCEACQPRLEGEADA
jgi:formamidopyrimidine-DNA glycosylase